MFRNVYKSANDDITPNPELLDKILSTQKKSYNTYRNFYKYGSVAAAFFILVGTLSVYPKIKDNLNVSDNTAAIEVKSEDTKNPDIFTPPADDEILAEASTALGNEKTPQSKTENKKESKPSKKQQSITPQVDESSELSEATDSPSPTTEDLNVITQTNPQIAEESVAKARVFVPDDTIKAYSGDEEIITQDEAVRLADEAFLADFGEEFLNSTEIKTEFSENYKITRFNENLSYTVTVFTDGLIEKEY